MAGNGDKNHVSAKEEWPFDVPDDFDDSLLHLLQIPGDSNAPMNFSGGYSSAADGGSPPAAGTAIAGPSTVSALGASSCSVDPGTLVDCTGCKILGETVHSNGFVTTKLCIHGAGFKFHHAIVDLYHGKPQLTPAHRSFTDFRGRDYLWVMRYLEDYAQQREAAGFRSTASWYSSMFGDDRHEAAAAEAENIDEQQLLANLGDRVLPMVEQEDILPVASGPSQQGNNAVNEQEQSEVGPMVTSSAMQSERVSNLKLRDISCYFHLTVSDASKELRVSTKVLRELRRKFGIKRWPYRTIKSIDDQIERLTNYGNGSAEAIDEIMKLYDSRQKIINVGR